jgi:hypothetical protein
MGSDSSRESRLLIEIPFVELLVRTDARRDLSGASSKKVKCPVEHRLFKNPCVTSGDNGSIIGATNCPLYAATLHD